jgi:RNA polymerase sigma factor (TIGR02999 family)
VALRVEDTCSRYERSWKAGRRPRLEDYLVAPDTPEYKVMLRELLAIDTDYRRQAGETPSAADYAGRFPGVEAAWFAKHNQELGQVEQLTKEVPAMLNAVEGGDPHAAEQLFPVVYQELRKLAAQKLAQEKPEQTLQATALVHEAYLRLVGQDHSRSYQDRAHFFAAAAAAMRHILIDNARRKLTQKRGGGFQRQDLDALAAPGPDDELIALDQAMQKLAATDPAKAKLVELLAATLAA